MLKDSLYTIQKISDEDAVIEGVIELNEHHDIFKGHFPGQPVLPGICMLQITKEILETFLQHKLQLSGASDIRFSAVVDPMQSKELQFVIRYDLSETPSMLVNTKILKKDDIVCCRMKCVFRQQL